MAADPLVDQQLALGLLVVGGGLLVAAFPGPIATMNETFDAVGSTRSDVEPTRWRVELTRVLGIATALVGVAFLLRAYGLWNGLVG